MIIKYETLFHYFIMSLGTFCSSFGGLQEHVNRI